jgi:hypothetical protein
VVTVACCWNFYCQDTKYAAWRKAALLAQGNKRTLSGAGSSTPFPSVTLLRMTSRRVSSFSLKNMKSPPIAGGLFLSVSILAI